MRVLIAILICFVAGCDSCARIDFVGNWRSDDSNIDLRLIADGNYDILFENNEGRLVRVLGRWFLARI